MALTDDDKDFLRLTMKVSVQEGFENHRLNAHVPIESDLGRIKGQISYWKGALALFSVLFAAALAAVELAK